VNTYEWTSSAIAAVAAIANAGALTFVGVQLRRAARDTAERKLPLRGEPRVAAGETTPPTATREPCPGSRIARKPARTQESTVSR
jgi:hypothetical protein